MSPEKIATIVRDLADLITVIRNADPADKAEIYTRPGLRLTYQPGEEPETGAVRTEVHVSPSQHWQFEGVRGAS
jgi:site-specific DNA recombinase